MRIFREPGPVAEKITFYKKVQLLTLVLVVAGFATMSWLVNVPIDLKNRGPLIEIVLVLMISFTVALPVFALAAVSLLVLPDIKRQLKNACSLCGWEKIVTVLPLNDMMVLSEVCTNSNCKNTSLIRPPTSFFEI